MNINQFKHRLKNTMKKSDRIFIVGHADLDLDAIGAAIGMYYIASALRKDAYIIIDDLKKEKGVDKVLSERDLDLSIITSNTLKEMTPTIKDLLIVVDCNKNFLLQEKNVIEYFSNIVVIDHHEENEDSIKTSLSIIDNKASSACEMVTDLVRSYKLKPTSYISTAILAGIILDTNNFVLKTTKDTFYSAYFLTSLGADPNRVQYYLKQDLDEYIERQKALTNIEVLHRKIALTKSDGKIKYRREDLAKLADTLLLFNDIEASFVIASLGDSTIGISARSIGNIAVNEILDHLGGGGSKHEAACKITTGTIQDIQKKLIDVINQYMNNI